MNIIAVIGGGVAGLQAALSLKSYGFRPVVFEKDRRLGGKLLLWDRLFPTRTPADEVLNPFLKSIEEEGIEVRLQCPVEEIGSDGKSVRLSGGEVIETEAVVVATGFELFDATLKEEYGYGLYDNVVTSADLERMFKEDRVLTVRGEVPRRVAILHCVGSRDEKVLQNHCSRVCCITGVKQAMEIKEMYPHCEVYNFYMDMRMFGPGYEEIYRKSQEECHVNHIRGRISEVGPTYGGRLQLKAEDTLVGRPMKMEVDLLVLMVGMCTGASNARLAEHPHLRLRPSGFFDTADSFAGNVSTGSPNICLAGTATAPKNIGESINDAAAAAYRIYRHLKFDRS